MAINVPKKGDGRLALALAAGASIREAADEAGMSHRTAYRRLTAPKFRLTVQSARDQMFEGALGLLAAISVKAVQALERLLNSESLNVQLGAARAILGIGQQLSERVDVDSRLRALEEKSNAE